MKKFFKTLLVVVMALTLLVPMGINGTEASAATKIKLNTTKKTINVGDTFKLKVSGTKKTVKWSTSNKKVATISSKGKVTGKGKGSCTITAQVAGKKLNCKVTVKAVKSVDDGTFYGLELVPSGQEVERSWHWEKNYGTVESPDWDSVNSDLPIKVEITTTTRDDGMIEKTATYYMRGGVNMSGDWVVNVYDYATGLDLEAKGYEAFGSETTRSEDGKTVIWSVTIVHDETVDPVFLWTQVTNNFEMCYRTNITNDEEYFNATERVLDNFTDLLSFEGGYWFLATK